MRWVEEAKTEAKETITELETLMTVARDAIEKAMRSLVAELTDVNLSRPDTTDTEQTTDMPTWCSPLSFRPIGNATIRSIVNLLYLTDPVNKPTTPRPNRKLEQLKEENHSVRAAANCRVFRCRHEFVSFVSLAPVLGFIFFSIWTATMLWFSSLSCFNFLFV